MKICCKASEPVTLRVEAASIPIQHYLRQPQRLVQAITDPRLMLVLGRDRYRLQMNPLNLLDLYHFHPTVILKVTSNSQGIVSLQSERCTIEGIDYIDNRFHLHLYGQLEPIDKDGATYLHGLAIVEVTVDVPPLFLFAPVPLLENAGHHLVKSVLGRIKQRILSHLIADYHTWAADISPAQISTLGLSTP
jgi:hypothetical protein